MKITGTVALVTGANRGLGAAYARALVERGAATVYAGARNPDEVTDPDVVPIALDVTDPAQIAAAVARCGDVALLINNAGVNHGAPLLGAPDTDGARGELETNLFGPLALARGFAPALARNGGGAIVNMLSVLSWLTFPQVGSYCASKAAAWSMTNAIRLELHAQGTLVVGVHAAYIDTDMAARVNAPKIAPAEVAHQVLDAVEAGLSEVLTDDVTRQVRAGLSADLTALYPQLAISS